LRQKNTASLSSFAFAQERIRECLSIHDCGRSSISRLLEIARLDLPKRLLDLGDNIKLVDNVQSDWNYAALSYCWGVYELNAINLKSNDTSATTTPDFLKRFSLTTSSTISKHMENIPIEVLPKTIRDAIAITRRLGIQYLWVDCLCIIQDSDIDWEIESPKMGTIYHRAKVTISVDRGDNMDSGCFNDSDNVRSFAANQSLLKFGQHNFQSNGQAIYFREYSKGEGIRVFNSTTVDLIKKSQEDPFNHALGSRLESRAWCFQERVLSSRILHYSMSQLYWECDHCFEPEDPSLSFKVSKNGASLYSPLFTSRRASLELTNNTDLIMTWCYHMLEDYCGRKVTFPSDRLPAISSIARLFNLQLQTEYVAGIFASVVHVGLAWAAQNPQAPPDNAEQNGLPSFSWISRAENRIRWHRFNFRDRINTCQFENAEISRRSQDLYGAIETAKLTIRGRFIEISLKVSPSQEGLPRWSGSDIAATCLVSGILDGESQSRIGHAWLDFLGFESQNAIFLELYSETDPSSLMRSIGILLRPASTTTYLRFGIAKVSMYADEFEAQCGNGAITIV
jgi:Heterokaryon incompatibility protein (HET)